MSMLNLPFDAFKKGWDAIRELLVAPSVDIRLADHERRIQELESAFRNLERMLDDVRSEVVRARDNIQSLRIDDIKIREEARTEVKILRAILDLILGQIQQSRKEVNTADRYDDRDRGFLRDKLNGVASKIGGSKRTLNIVEERLNAAG